MFSSLHIKGYRAFEDFRLSNLGRVNLLVGMNNSGKTSILEALFLLGWSGELVAISDLLWRRGELEPWQFDDSFGPTGPTGPSGRNRQPLLNASHLFTGHDIKLGSFFEISTSEQDYERSIKFSIINAQSRENKPQSVTDSEITSGRSALALEIEGVPPAPVKLVGLSRSSALILDGFYDLPMSTKHIQSYSGLPCQFITADSFDAQNLVRLWDKIALTPNESRVLSALQFVDPEIEGIAAQVGTVPYGGTTRGGFVLKMQGREAPVPIGSMGDGIWRLLAMAIAIAHCKGGILLVDEIDTGLHHSVMSDMWKLIYRASEELDVQVFATTHSLDCVHSLASVCSSDMASAGNITLQRIESGKSASVAYSEVEIQMAAEQSLEVR